jgi:hypothetical protein
MVITTDALPHRYHQVPVVFARVEQDALAFVSERASEPASRTRRNP